jgi:OOP family OmpA-OmpF porin
MKSTFTPKQAALAAFCVLAFSVFSSTSVAQTRDIDEKALLLDTRGAPVMNASGQCWHTAYGPAPVWTSGCHAPVPTPVAQYVAPAPQPVVQQPIAAPIAAAPAPRPAPVIVAAAAPLPVYEKVSFDANVLFDSNKSELRPAGRATLDQFIEKISGLESQSVMAIGYADRMGTDASNQLLSEQRVNIVKSYLVSKGVSANRVQTSALGETRPTTYAAECKDANNTRNVACMQPDRHVFIEISGSRIAK